MGKKSSLKKQKREGKDQASSKASSKSRVGIRQRVQDWLPSPEKWVATGMVVIGLLMLGTAALTSWIELTRPKSLSLFVPKDTIGIVEVNTDLQDSQWEDFQSLTEKIASTTNTTTTSSQNSPEILPKNAFPKIADLIEKLNTSFSIDFTKDIYPWLGRRAGIALLADFKPALFLEVKDEKRALAYFQTRRLQGTSADFQDKEYRGVTMHEYATSTPFAMMSLGRYLIVTGDESSAKKIIDASDDRSGTLYSQYAYQRVQKAFSSDRLAFVYGKPEYKKLLMLNGETSPMGLTEEQALSGIGGGESVSGISGMIKIFSDMMENVVAGEGVNIKMLGDKLALEHFAFFNEATRAGKKFIKSSEKYQANLAEFFSPDTEFFAGGQDLPSFFKQLENMTSATITSGTPDTTNPSSKIATSSLETQLIKNFAGKLTTQEFDKLTKNEYAIGLDHGAMKIVVTLNGIADKEKESLLKKLAYNASVSEHGPDSAPRPYATRLLGDIGVITSAPEELDATVALWTASTSIAKKTLKTSAIYQQMIEPLMQSADDIIFIRPTNMTQLTGSLAWLRSIPQISLASTSFEDGIKTTIFIAAPSISSSSPHGT